MNNFQFPHYTTEYISGVMSLRKPQEKSLEILDEILQNVNLDKNLDLEDIIAKVNKMYPICTNFERDFMSITFALATGVGKTRLMGAFIAYLYTNHGIKNFFIVAPGTTVYDKLKKDLSDPSSTKYVFKGLGCFNGTPQIITDDDYREKQLTLYDNDIHIFVYNIDKFNKDNAKMKDFNEVFGSSFYGTLSNLSDLVLIMDESHHYRAEQGVKALNELKPLLGLELTATPLAKVKSKQVPFKNVVYEYPLSKAIEDGYTRTPFAVTRSDISFYNFGDEQIDKIMLIDGIICHEEAKKHLKVYSENNNKKAVKPFMLVVCKDTNHATWVENYIKSDEFKNGAYKNKVITVHSKKSGTESDFNTKLLLSVEEYDNPIEIVIHVNMLKEGWDVNNLYTIVPLRTASSKILREQMIGRGLRLPYGERTGDKQVDSVMLTAHDKFEDILSEAQKGDSIFKSGNVIKVEELVPEKVEYTQIAFELEKEITTKNAYAQTNLTPSKEHDEFFEKTVELIKEEVTKEVQLIKSSQLQQKNKGKIVSSLVEKMATNRDLGEVFKENECPLTAWLQYQTEETYKEVISKYIPIPRIKITDNGVQEYVFVDFDIELSEFNHVPIENKMLIQNLEDITDRSSINGEKIDFDGYNPQKQLLQQLREKPEIDYEKCSVLLFKLIIQVCDFYSEVYSENGMKNIVMMYRRDIANKIYTQMMKHFYCENGFLREEVISIRDYNLTHTYSSKEQVKLFDNYTLDIRSVLFEGIKKGVFTSAKFDSHPELIFARVLEVDSDVKNWLRPATKEFNITYNNGRQYEPDFVVETDKIIYLVEVKGEDRITEPNVIAKKNRAIKYCEVASNWGKANGYKEWRYLFIPSKQVQASSSFEQLAIRFREL